MKRRLNKHSIELDQDMTNLSLYYLDKILLHYNKTLKNFSGLPLIPINFKPVNFNKSPNFCNYQPSYDLIALKLLADTNLKV